MDRQRDPHICLTFQVPIRVTDVKESEQQDADVALASQVGRGFAIDDGDTNDAQLGLDIETPPEEIVAARARDTFIRANPDVNPGR